MKEDMREEGSGGSPARQLAMFISKYDPQIDKLARTARLRLRRQMPSAVELVYDNYNALAIGFGPTERASDVIVSLALYPRWVSLFFMQGAALPDPHKLLRGSENVVRHIVLDGAADLDKPEVRTSLIEAIHRARVPLPRGGRGRTVIKSISPKQRPRRLTSERSAVTKANAYRERVVQ
jgi:hypothetical protein